MGEDVGNLEEADPVRSRRFWGLRPWKRHDLILTVAGAIYTLVGLAYVLGDDTPSRLVSLQVLVAIFPIKVWGAGFVAAGVLTIISSRWPPMVETWGYVLLTSLSVGWGTAYLMGIVFGSSPWANINGFFLWTLLGFMWWAVSGLLNPDKTGVATDAGTRPD